MNTSKASALEVLDRAIERVRSEAPGRLFMCALPGLLLTWLALLVYYLEEVEGVRSLRPLFAVGFAAGFVLRGGVLARYAGDVVDRELSPLAAEPRHVALGQVLRVAIVLGTELWMWLWLVVLALRVDPWFVLAVLPLLCLRGALAPSWLAAAEQGPPRGTLGALLEVLSVAEGGRLRGVLLEAFFLFGALLLFLNLGALSVALLSLSQDLLGLSLSFVRAFVSPQNRFALLSLSGLSLAAFEPLRAAVSGVLHAETRREREALEVRAFVRRAVSGSHRTALAVLFGALLVGRASAQEEVPAAATPRPTIEPSTYDPTLPALSLAADEECDKLCSEARQRDDEVLGRVVSILDAPEFREFSDRRWDLDGLHDDSLRRVLDDFLRWLLGDEKRARNPAELSASQPLRVPPTFLLGVLSVVSLAALVLIWLHARPRSPQRASRTPPKPAPEPSTDLELEPAPGDARTRLRALYLSALEGLSRRGFFGLESTRTNGQYLRALQVEPEHGLLLRLTGAFERARYGDATPSQGELEEAQAIAEQLVSGAP